MNAIHIMHFVHRFDYGGLENGLVNLINNLPVEKYRHTVVALTETSSITKRISAPKVEILALNKKAGKDLPCYRRIFSIIKERRPDVVHTRNLGTLDIQLLAWVCKVPMRVHSEHGRDVDDPDGSLVKPKIQRRLIAPLVKRWICVSKELLEWCRRDVGLNSGKLTHICNGVDTKRYAPKVTYRNQGAVVFGTVTRFSPIKDPLNAVEAFAMLGGDHRLIMVGDGPLLESAKTRVRELSLQDRIHFTGEIGDTANVYSQFDVFLLGSKREGISNTVLEAMAAGLPVIACDVGGNSELIDTRHGALVPPEDAKSLACAMRHFADNMGNIEEYGRISRQKVVEKFSLQVMTQRYDEVYSLALHTRRSAPNR